MLYDGIIRDFSVFCARGGRAIEEERSLEDVIPLEGLVLLHDYGMDIGDKEEGGQGHETEASAERDAGHIPSRLLGQTEPWRFVDNRQGTDGASDQEETWRRPHGRGYRVATDVDNQLNQHRDGGSEAA